MYKDKRKESNDYANSLQDEYSAGYVYAVYSPTYPEFIKIGITQNLCTRIKSYNSYNPYSDFRYIAVSKFCLNTKEIEDMLKNTIPDKSLVANEWFDIKHKEYIITVINSIQGIN